MTNLEGRVIRRRVVAAPPGRGPRRPRRPPRAGRPARARRQVRVPLAARGVRRVPPGHRRRPGRLLPASPTSGSTARTASSGRARRRTTPARRGCSPTASPTPTARPGSTPSSTARPARSPTPTTRSTSPPAGTRSTTTPAPRPGWSPRSIERPAAAAAADPPPAGRPARASQPASVLIVESRRGPGRVRRRGRRPTSARTPLFAPFHWGGRQAANLLTNPALDPTSRMPEFKLARRADRRAVARRPDRTDPPQDAGADDQATPRDHRQRHGHRPAARRAGPPRRAGRVRRQPSSARSRTAAYNRILLEPRPRRRGVDEITLKPPAWYAEQGVALLPRAWSSPGSRTPARRLWTADGGEHHFDVAVFATGSLPRVPAGGGADGGRTARSRPASSSTGPWPTASGCGPTPGPAMQRGGRRRRAARAGGGQGAGRPRAATSPSSTPSTP